MKVLLMGNPNVGKSVVFNRLTGANVIASNYPGTTVEFTRGRMRIGGESIEVIDVPGTYSLDPTCKAEQIACRMLNDMTDVVIINIVDSTNLERNLNLTLQLIKRRIPMIVALNYWDETKHKGIQIDQKKLEEIIGIPCLPVVAITGEGIKAMVEKIPGAKISPYDYDEDERWNKVGSIVLDIQKMSHRHHTFLERLGDASVKPFPGIFISFIILFLSFEIIRLIGENIITFVFVPLFELVWAPVIMKLSVALGGEGIIHDILIGKLVDGGIDFEESFGILTTGLFVPFAAVLPYVLAFYMILSFLEDSGYLPRLAVLMDNLMHRIGLHGMAIIPMMLGLGCNVPGALSTRIMETRRERFMAMTLMAVTVPCMAQISMIIGLSGEYGSASLLPIFGSLFAAWIVLGFIMNQFVKGESPEILTDVPPYRIPYIPGLFKKIWMRILWFLREAVPWVLAGVFIINIMDTLGIISFFGGLAAPVITGIAGLPEEAVGGLVVGFLRKDVAVGMLAPLHLSLKQIIIASVMLTMYFPCVATFTVMIRELGILDMLKSALIMISSSLIVGGLLNLIL
jgi:ferrous iron transport protein B